MWQVLISWNNSWGLQAKSYHMRHWSNGVYAWSILCSTNQKKGKKRSIVFSKVYKFIWSSMWPLYVLVNKLLRTDEQYDQQPDDDLFSSVESFPFRQLVMSGNNNAALLPHSHFVDVSLFNFYSYLINLFSLSLMFYCRGISSQSTFLHIYKDQLELHFSDLFPIILSSITCIFDLFSFRSIEVYACS